MIPIQKVFMIDAARTLDRKTIQNITRRCYSNILVYDSKPENVIGLIRTKHLISYCDQDIQINLRDKEVQRELIQSIPIVVTQNTNLLQMLMIFKNQKSEVALIRSETSRGKRLNEVNQLEKDKYSKFFSASHLLHAE